jgi:hypothetical protein
MYHECDEATGRRPELYVLLGSPPRLWARVLAVGPDCKVMATRHQLTMVGEMSGAAGLRAPIDQGHVRSPDGTWSHRGRRSGWSETVPADRERRAAS